MDLLRGFARLTGTVVACAGMAVAVVAESAYDSLSGNKEDRRLAQRDEAIKLKEEGKEIICKCCNKPIEGKIFHADPVNFQKEGFHCKECHDWLEASYSSGG